MNQRQWLGLLCLGIVLVIFWKIREMLLLLFAAVVLAVALNSLVRQFQRLGMQRGAAIGLSLMSVLVFGALFISIVIPPFVSQLLSLIEILPQGVEIAIARVEEFIERQPEFISSQFDSFNFSFPDLAQQVQPVVQNLLKNFFTFFSSSFLTLGKFLLVLVLTIMLLVNPLAYRHVFIQLFPSFYRQRVDEILVECEVALGSWLAGFLISSSFVAILCGVGLLALGVPLVLAHALLAGAFNLIPNIGPTLSTIFPATVAFLVAPWKAIAVVILYVLIQNFESYLLTPTVMAKQVSLLPAFTLAAQIFFAQFFGVLGLVLALPLTVVAKVWIQEALIKDVLDTMKAHKAPRFSPSAPPQSSSVLVLPNQIAIEDSNPKAPPESTSTPSSDWKETDEVDL